MSIESILNIDCSMYSSAKTTLPVSVNLLEWLTSDKYLQKQTKVRTALDAEAKRIAKEGMPCISPSGVFSQRGKKYLTKHTGLIAIDIDQKDNLHIENYPKLKDEISKIPNVAYCGLSVSGTGYWALIPIAYPEKHELHFEFIRKYFEGKNLIIDRACSDVARLRFYSYDSEAYFNHSARPLQSYFKPLEPKTKQIPVRTFGGQEKPVWEQYNEERFFIEALQKHGWTIDSENGTKTYFTRPGKQSGISAEYDSSKNIMFVFTDGGAPLEPRTGYNPFQVFAILEHSGDFSKAAKALILEKGTSYKKILSVNPQPIQPVIVAQPEKTGVQIFEEWIAKNKEGGEIIVEGTRIKVTPHPIDPIQRHISQAKKDFAASRRKNDELKYYKIWANSMKTVLLADGITEKEFIDAINHTNGN